MVAASLLQRLLRFCSKQGAKDRNGVVFAKVADGGCEKFDG